MQAVRFLKGYEYLNTETRPNDSSAYHDVLSEAIRNVQRMGDLPVTGQLNAETIKLMNTSRCGTKDPIEKLNKTEDGRKEIGRYYIQGTRWNKKVYCLFWSEWLGILSFYLMDRRLQDCFFFGEIAKSEIAKVTLYSPERSNDGFFKRFTSVEEV